MRSSIAAAALLQLLLCISAQPPPPLGLRGMLESNSVVSMIPSGGAVNRQLKQELLNPASSVGFANEAQRQLQASTDSSSHEATEPTHNIHDTDVSRAFTNAGDNIKEIIHKTSVVDPRIDPSVDITESTEKNTELNGDGDDGDDGGGDDDNNNDDDDDDDHSSSLSNKKERVSEQFNTAGDAAGDAAAGDVKGDRPADDGHHEKEEVETKSKCEQCKTEHSDDEDMCAQDCACPAPGVTAKEIVDKVSDGIQAKMDEGGCPKLELSFKCLHALSPNQQFIGMTLEVNKWSAGAELLFDLDTMEFGLMAFGAFSLGTNWLAGLGAGVYIGVGWKGDEMGQGLEESMDETGEGWGMGADISLGISIAVAKADLAVAVGIAADPSDTKNKGNFFSLKPKWSGGKSLAIEAGVGAGGLELPIDFNIGIDKKFYLFGLELKKCGELTPYCVAASLFLAAPLVPIWSKIFIMMEFMDKWCLSEDGKGSYFCESTKDLPEPKVGAESETILLQLSNGEHSWESVLSVWADKGTHAIKLLEAAFKAGKMALDKMKEEYKNAKKLVAKALQKYVGKHIDSVREKFGDVDPDKVAIERHGMPKNHAVDGGVYVRIKDCGPADKFKDEERPYWECIPYDDVKEEECDTCVSRETSAGIVGKKSPEDAHADFVEGPLASKMYWDYSDNDGEAGWGRIWRGHDKPQCVQCHMWGRARNWFDTEYEDFKMKICGGDDAKDDEVQEMDVEVFDGSSSVAKCSVLYKYNP